MLKVKLELIDDNGNTNETTYNVDLPKGSTVLQVLDTIYRKYEPTLAFRYSCRIGLCGTCSVKINGKPGLCCLKAAEPGEDGYLKIEPLPNRRTISDLAKEM